jgi:23S rRNA (uracil1939-C5)-methyltransferase
VTDLDYCVLKFTARSGRHPKALKALLEKKPHQIANISCDPATLARDLSKITGSDYRLEKVFLLDLFPQTYHIETVVFCNKTTI